MEALLFDITDTQNYTLQDIANLLSFSALCHYPQGGFNLGARREYRKAARDMNLVKVKLSQLKPDKRNARRHDERNIEEIKRSLQKNEQYRPFVVQRGTNRICVGNGMYEAMKQLGIKEGWAEYRDLTDEEFTQLALSDNQTALLADWDVPMLKDLMQELGPDADIPGWSAEEIEQMFEVPEDMSEEYEGAEETESEVQMLRCPQCGHINNARAFRLDAADTEEVCQ